MNTRIYIAPVAETVGAEPVMLLAGSGVSADGIGYGGIDIDGLVTPEAPELDMDLSQTVEDMVLGL